MIGQGARAPDPGQAGQLQAFVIELLLARSPLSCSLLSSGESAWKRREGERGSLCRDAVGALRGRLSLKIIQWQVLIQSQSKSLSGQGGRAAWGRGTERVMTPLKD